MASPLVDTKPALPLVDGNNKSSGVGGCDVDKSATRENGIEHDSDLKISLLPAVFEVVRTMEEKDAGKVSASDVTNQLTQFHGKLKKAREAVEKHLPAATIGNMTLDDQEDQLRILRDQLKMNSSLMASYTKIMSTAFMAQTPTSTPNASSAPHSQSHGLSSLMY